MTDKPTDLEKLNDRYTILDNERIELGRESSQAWRNSNFDRRSFSVRMLEKKDNTMQREQDLIEEITKDQEQPMLPVIDEKAALKKEYLARLKKDPDFEGADFNRIEKLVDRDVEERTQETRLNLSTMKLRDHLNNHGRG